MTRDPKKRLGYENETSIRNHPFFVAVDDWSELRLREAPRVLTATGVGSDATVTDSECDHDDGTDTDDEWRARVNAAAAALDAL